MKLLDRRDRQRAPCVGLSHIGATAAARVGERFTSESVRSWIATFSRAMPSCSRSRRTSTYAWPTRDPLFLPYRK